MLLLSLSLSCSPQAENPARDIEMAPRKTKSKVEDEEVPDLATGWKKSKMSEAAVWELEDSKMLQSQGLIQWRPAEGEDRPYEGTLEIVMFCNFVERGLAVPV